MPTDTDSQIEQLGVIRSYDPMAWLYDFYDAPMELLGPRRRRRSVIPQAYGETLEIGVGTGKDLAHYRPDVELSAVDGSAPMLRRPERRAAQLGRQVKLDLVSVTAMPSPDDAFDTTVATSVVCSIAAPVDGLRELGRVTKPHGQIL
ncbi:MAG: class I SAM-dependent methyltransferase, partial [Acidimicrobiia bacterium]|nr:class I SAM-dependent methyltransferase [Acidimicrobiia bacterium]